MRVPLSRSPPGRRTPPPPGGSRAAPAASSRDFSPLPAVLGLLSAGGIALEGSTPARCCGRKSPLWMLRVTRWDSGPNARPLQWNSSLALEPSRYRHGVNQSPFGEWERLLKSWNNTLGEKKSNKGIGGSWRWARGGGSIRALFCHFCVISLFQGSLEEISLQIELHL